jgi:hypothetical protein
MQYETKIYARSDVSWFPLFGGEKLKNSFLYYYLYIAYSAVKQLQYFPKGKDALLSDICT